MALRLPPLSALRLFEAAGRHQSFRKAAEELHVTPSAVSHAVVGLEAWLGVALFVREPRRLALTAEGAEYLPYVSEALSLIAIGTQRLPSRHATREIRITAAPTVASRWLLPRLPRFAAEWPNVSVTVDTSHRQAGFPVDGFDFAIRLSRAPAAGAEWTRLFGQILMPVCAPSYPHRHDLGQARLLHVTSVSEDWPAWCEATGTPLTEAGMRFDALTLAWEAAAAGMGVALGCRPLVDRELAAGTLVATGHPAIAAETAYWLVSAEGAERRPELRAFRRWLLAEAAEK